jgi:formate hydrogenlyase subunit 3/multisubunit Na+/H+ antiporter MnhD subunit
MVVDADPASLFILLCRILQSRGWPFLLFVWGVIDFATLSGARPFFGHWLYWQSTVHLFNDRNPSGNIVNSIWNHRILAIAVSVGTVVSMKRFWLGLYLGRQTFGKKRRSAILDVATLGDTMIITAHSYSSQLNIQISLPVS